jgi:hypothetical protein
MLFTPTLIRGITAKYVASSILVVEACGIEERAYGAHGVCKKGVEGTTHKNRTGFTSLAILAIGLSPNQDYLMLKRPNFHIALRLPR